MRKGLYDAAVHGIRLLLAAVLSASACSQAPVVPPAAVKAQAAGALVLPFIEDDYGRALAEAKAKAVPLFIEAWAPW